MATTKEIKNRIKSVKDTQKITNAMYLISSTKMTKAKRELENTRPYFDMLKQEIVYMIHMRETADSLYFMRRLPISGQEDDASDENSDTVAYLVITADKGLAGAYNQNVIKEAVRRINDSASYKLFVVGEYGRRFFEDKGMNIDRSFLYTAQNPTLERAREITAVITELYAKGRISKFFIIYTDFKNGLTGGDVVTMELLPFSREDFLTDAGELEEISSKVEYVPNVNAVLNNIVPSFVTGYIYSALVNSFCAEQSARMSAMDAANENAEELLSSLNLEYNHVRQSAITQEITEVSAGSRGQKRNRDKR